MHATPRITDLEAETAELGFLGYPSLTSPDGLYPSIYDYQQLNHTETWRDQSGLATRYGDTRELLAKEDDHLVVMAHGDELQLRFDAESLPELPSGWRRDLVLYSVGYAKDLDLHSARPDTVGPLPYRQMPSYPYPDSGPYANPEFADAIEFADRSSELIEIFVIRPYHETRMRQKLDFRFHNIVFCARVPPSGFNYRRAIHPESKSAITINGATKVKPNLDDLCRHG